MKRMLALAIVSLAILAHAETGWGRHKKVYVVPTPGKVVIDGRLDDWDLSPQIEAFVMSETRERQNALFSMMYDEEALYVSGVVRDDSPMMNRNDPAVRGDAGWDADACQLRLTVDPDIGYPVNYTWGGDPTGNRGGGNVSLLTLWYFTDAQKPVLQMRKDMDYKIPNGWTPFGVVPDGLYEAAYVMNEAKNGYTFEYRIPWTTLGAKRPMRGGDLLACSVQFNWGRPDGLHYAGIASATYDVYVPPGFPYQNTGCWGKVIFSETGDIDKALVEEGVIPPRPLPLTFSYAVPEAGEVSVVLLDKSNTVVRILTASSPRQAGEAHDAWDGMDMWGDPLLPGEYTWKGLVREALSVKVKMSVHNSGQPGWQTDDISSSWGGDHACPSTVCALEDGMLLAWADTESGSAIIRTDLNGKKTWGTRTAGQHIVTDGERFFVAGHAYIKTVKCFDLKDARPLNFGNGNPEVEKPEGAEGGFNVSGLAYADGTLYAAYGKEGVIGVYDAKSGDLKKALTLGGTVGRIAWDEKGNRLLAVARLETDLKTEGGAWGVVSIPVLPSGLQSLGLQSVTSSNLDDPRGIAVDKEGRVYVANQGALQNVSVFGSDGAYLCSIGKAGGRPARGLYDQDGMYCPGGIAISADGTLWVAEIKDSPRRHSVWKKTEGLKDGGGEWVFDKEFFGGCEYNGWVWMDTADPSLVYCHNTKWEIDIDKGTWRPVSTMWRTTEPNMVEESYPNGYAGHLRVITAKNGRRYAFGRTETGARLYREDGDVFKPFAGLIHVKRPPKGTFTGVSYPLLYDNPEKYPDVHPHGWYVWADKNDDQIIQEDEFPGIFSDKPWIRGGMFKGLDRDLNIWCEGWLTNSAPEGYLIVPKSIDENGLPHYDFENPDIRRGFPLGQVFQNEDETQIFTFRELSGEKMALAGWNADMTPAWIYNNLPHWAVSLGHPLVKPGLLHGLTQGLGVAGEFTGAVSYFGPYQLFTTDGIYVGMLMRDYRDGLPLGEDTHATECVQGQIVKLTMPRGASSAEVQNGDMVDRYFLLGGANDGRITEIFGLDTVKRLSGGVYVHTEEMAETAVKARQDYDLMMAKSRKMEIQRGRAALEKAAAVERVVDGNRRFSVQTAYDAENMYFRYDMQNGIPLANATPDPVMIFKGGNCIDIQILKTEDLKAEDQKGEPRRLLVTRQDGKPLAMLYHSVVPEGSEPIMFYSSSGQGALGAIANVTDKVKLEVKEQPGGFVAVVTVPQELFGLSLRPSQEVTMDVGYIFGNREGNQVIGRAYWSNNGFAANVINDVPNEILMVPDEWGKASVE